MKTATAQCGKCELVVSIVMAQDWHELEEAGDDSYIGYCPECFIVAVGERGTKYPNYEKITAVKHHSLERERLRRHQGRGPTLGEFRIDGYDPDTEFHKLPDKRRDRHDRQGADDRANENH